MAILSINCITDCVMLTVASNEMFEMTTPAPDKPSVFPFKLPIALARRSDTLISSAYLQGALPTHGYLVGVGWMHRPTERMKCVRVT